MGKNNRIKLEFEGTSYVLGIASHERIWKLCWELNKALGINLTNEREDLANPLADALYSDFVSDSDFEYQLRENIEKSSRIPKIAQQFRFWLICKPVKGKVPDLDKMLKAINRSETVTMVMDLTQFNQEKQFLP